jgi:hypothetical protein
MNVTSLQDVLRVLDECARWRLHDHAKAARAYLATVTVVSSPTSAEPSGSSATLAEQAKPVALKHWTFCPECGCEGSRPTGYGTGRYCSDCGQEWFTDIDYLDVCRTNLHSLFRRAHPAPDTPPSELVEALRGLVETLLANASEEGLTEYEAGAAAQAGLIADELAAILNKWESGQ